MSFIKFNKQPAYQHNPVVNEIKEAIKPEVLEESDNDNQNNNSYEPSAEQQALDLAKYYFARAEYYNHLGNQIIQELE